MSERVDDNVIRGNRNNETKHNTTEQPKKPAQIHWRRIVEPSKGRQTDETSSREIKNVLLKFMLYEKFASHLTQSDFEKAKEAGNELV